MTSDQNINYGLFPQSFHSNQNVVSFQTGTINSTGMGILPSNNMNNFDGYINRMDGSNQINGVPTILNASCPMVVPISSGMIGTSDMVSTSSARGMMVDQVKGNLNYDSSISVDWSQYELEVLRKGLARHGNEPNIMKYIKIASQLPQKTVRDVAMRCQWITRKESAKRRKSEEYYAGLNIQDNKEIAVDPSLWASNCPVQSENATSPSFIVNNLNQNNQISCGGIDNVMQQVLDENKQLLTQIQTNIGTFQTQNNIPLIERTRKNITLMLQCMNQMPGVMIRMPQLPVSLDERLINGILPSGNLGETRGGWQAGARNSNLI